MIDKTKPTVFIVDDDAVLCKALQWLLESVELQVEIFPDGHAYLNSHDNTRTGCLLIDVRMPKMSGLELQECLTEKNNRIPIIMLTGHGDVPMAVRAMKVGAFDFIAKPFNDQQLLEQVQKAIAKNLNEKAVNQHDKVKLKMSTLTEREQTILKLIVDGKMNKQIAAELSISMKTVELHRANIMHKMQAKSLAELIKNYLLIESS